MFCNNNGNGNNLLWLILILQNPVAAQAANKGGGHPAALSWQHLWLSC